tara:strand:- start:101 stop:580 length:480 start_codon:yes stop_codon:yes gene_type:complete
MSSESETERDLEVYEKMTWETPTDELLDAVENLVVKNRQLKAELKEEKENFALFRDKVAVPALQHAHKQLNERDGEDPTIAWVVDLMHEHDYRMQDAEFFYTEEEARRFVDAISDPKVRLNDGEFWPDSWGWVVTDCYEITKSKMSKSAYDALKKHTGD